MKLYQRHKGKYTLPGTVYMKTVYQIRDYYRLKDRIADVIEGSPDPGEVHVSGGKQVSVTEQKAIKISGDSQIVAAIEDALLTVPDEYRDGVWKNIMIGCPYPSDAARSTYGMYKSKFVYNTAEKLGWI